MTAEALLGTPPTGECIVMSSGRNAYRAAIPPGLVGIACLYGAITVGDAVFFVGAVAFFAFGAGRAALWYHCRDDSLWDDGTHLLWSRGNRVVTAVAWADLPLVWVDRLLWPPEWRIGGRRRLPDPTLPELWVRATTPPVGNQIGVTPDFRFATLVLIRRRDLDSACTALARSCARHGVEFVSESSGRWLGTRRDAVPWRRPDRSPLTPGEASSS